MFGRGYHCSPLIHLTIVVLLGGNEFGVQSYINSPHALPLSRQMLYLEELTSDVVSAQPGALSNRQIAASHTLLHAWSHTDQVKTNDRCEAARKVEALIKRLVDERRAGNSAATIDTADYNCVLEGWARCGNEASAMRAESVLEAMEEHGPFPNLDSYKACLMAWWNCRRLPYAPHRAQRILDKLIANSRRADIPSGSSPVPDSDCFDICLLLHSANGNAQSAERLLATMAKFAQPKISSFNAVLRAWFNSKDHQEAADRMQTILTFMETQPQLSPDKSSYRTVMNTFLHLPNHKEALQRSDDLLRHVLSLEDRPEVLDRIMFNGPMGLWAKSKDPRRYRRARWILDQEMQHQVPDVVGLTTVLGACAFSKEQQAVEIAVSTYRLFQKLNVKPNYITFGTMLKVCSNMNDDHDEEYKTKWITRVFRDATSSGQFHGMVRTRLKQAASPSLYKELLGDHAGEPTPPEWCCNIDTQNNDKASRKRAEV